MCTFFSTERKIAASLAVLRSTVHLPDTVVLLDIHSIEYFTQVTQTIRDGYMNTSDYLLLYIVVITIAYCSVSVLMKLYGV